ncbi:sugar-binding protein [Curtobacterium flaccumfaciens pv. flaccumfaciens]|jgi:putative multiple sugar transport system substrate-binding protein|uniref:multiple monosaccharide ABC transporter substrate-binding protein n=1 Tax=Curtobacterium TaxID=2034 RepID=UPI000DA85D34|nr:MULTISPECIES: multiple monosaccharide ABC transporter substrate-binding protein [Curtobacterium]MBF4627206.1 sugar-binding protein [Curtobacterium flaccumfaciens]MBO9048797.1 sugar-binding protein [Curtobacterium flaccumfaciens pv. flaccumfaciens]MBO9058176.1 sugar-binding protein [Curtobacterium flaccumfaciens pv. flaccumfaciens]MCS6551995.1 sugar ABC transporter substrate-binding protein [Curtobacterium flaccumfaciens pv. flaccumfaciens]PZE27463.1 sugar ABC transporter substrate-binding p
MMKRRIIAGVAAVGIAISLAACSAGGRASTDGGGSGDNKGALVGVAMPTKVSERWIKDGNAVKSDLEKAGYKVDLEYGDNKVQQQAQQVSNMITKGAKVLIIASIDGGALSDQLDAAAKAGIKVISYDRLLTGNKNVDYYVSFDNEKVGVDQANSLLTGLGVLDADGKKTGEKGPFNIEVFAGSLDDNNAGFFFNGAMKTLKPYLADGTLKIQSGQDELSQAATQQWDPATAKARMQNLIAKSYSGGTTLDGVLSPYDGISIGIISALQGAGYGTSDRPLPTVTGQDAEAASVKSIIAGQQYSTIYKDTRKLAKQSVTMAEDLLTGKDPEVNDTKSYDNKVKVVPTFLFQPTVVTKDNYKEVLVDSGYYTEADLK